MKIGVQMYTVRDYTKNEEDIEATLRRIKALGFDMVQISGIGPCGIDKLAGWMEELGITACGTHSPWERVADSAELKKLIEEHKKLKIPQIGIGKKPDIYPNSYEGYTRFIKKVNEICGQAKDAGLGFGYHNHNFEFEKWNGVCAMDRLINECPDLEFIVDFHWVQAGGANPCTYIEKIGSRQKIAHLKDYRMEGWERRFAEVGQGNLEWRNIFAGLEKHNVASAVIEQDAHFKTGDPFESLAISRKFLVEKGYWKD
jgi:sugar phosphate isomerase/epimerase